MGITAGFLVKHVRPIGTGYDAYASQQLIDFLGNALNFSPGDIAAILAEWRRVAGLDPEDDTPAFIAAARAVADARWGELYPTDLSTLVFLDANQLADLSRAGAAAGANATFDWRPGAPIAIAVTIRRPEGHHVVWEAAGMRVTTDADGNVVHFGALIAN